MNSFENAVFEKLLKESKEIYKGNGCPAFFHFIDESLVADEIKKKGQTLNVSQNRIRQFLELYGIRYRLWEVDDSGKSQVVYDTLDHIPFSKNKKATVVTEIKKEQAKLSKLQKIILVYIGVNIKQSNSQRINRVEITEEIYRILYGKRLAERTDHKHFPSVVANSVRELSRRNLIIKKNKATVSINENGKDIARNIISETKRVYGNVTWDTIKQYVYKDSAR